jgi:large subunit ribosomal protein L25
MATQTIPKIEVQNRDRVGTRYAARLRKDGRIPAVIYGHGIAAVHVSVDVKQLTDLMHDNAHLLEVLVEGKAESCLIKEVQWDHLGSDIIHVDLTRVDLSETVSVEVGLTFKGEPDALKEPGAIMEHPNTMIDIECRADSIPSELIVDVSSLGVNETITVADLVLPEGVTCTMHEETVVAVVRIVEELPDEEEVAAEGAEEPEVIGRDKEDDEDADDAKE